MARDLTRTQTAIKKYDIASDEFDVYSDNMQYDEAIAKMDELEKLEEAVGEAFGLDTADINNVDTCRQCIRPGPAVPGPGYELSFVRRMVQKWTLDI